MDGNWEPTVTGKVPCLPLIHLYTRHTRLFECSSYHGAWPFPPEMSAPTWMHTELPKTLVSCESSPEIPTHRPTVSQPRSLPTFSLLSFVSMVCFPLLKWWISTWNGYFGISLLSCEILVLVKTSIRVVHFHLVLYQLLVSSSLFGSQLQVLNHKAEGKIFCLHNKPT